MNVLSLVQLTQFSAAGGEGYFLGAQKVLHQQQIRGEHQLTQLVEGALETAILPGEAIASGLTFRLARTGDLRDLPLVCGLLAQKPLPDDIRSASVQIGQRLWEASRLWQWAQSLHDQLDPFVQRSELHHAVAFGALVSEATNSQIRAIATYLFHVARSIVAAAVRLIPLEEQIGQRVLSAVQPRIAQLAAACADKGLNDIASHNRP